jgi:Zn-dependent metalloprotease
MKAPGTAYDDKILGRDPQPANMRDYVKTHGDGRGVHINCGIPSRVLSRGNTPRRTRMGDRGEIWYRA